MVRKKGRLVHIHTKKFRRCVEEVRKKAKGKYNPYAVCMKAIGRKGALVKK